MPQFVQRNALGLIFGLAIAAVSIYAADAWKSKDIAQWTTNDIERVLNDSPWAQQAPAGFSLAAHDEPPPPPPPPGPAQAGLGGPVNPPGVHWDGGVGRPRGPNPTLNVLIRWDSAFPVQEALRRSENGNHDTALANPATHYVISIIGLVPAGRYRSVGTPESQSRSDGMIDARNPEQMLEGLMAASVLIPKDKPPIRPDDAKLDGKAGTLHIFFPRTEAITLSDKQVSFKTRFGALTIQKQFRLKDMVYKGKLEL